MPSGSTPVPHECRVRAPAGARHHRVPGADGCWVCRILRRSTGRTDHGEVELSDVRVLADTVGEVDAARGRPDVPAREQGSAGGECLGAAQYCIDRAVEYANDRNGRRRRSTRCSGHGESLVRLLGTTRRPSWTQPPHGECRTRCRWRLAIGGVRGRRPAMQVFGGVGYSRHQPFDIVMTVAYRITEGAEEIRIRRVVSGSSVSAASQKHRLGTSCGLVASRTRPSSCGGARGRSMRSWRRRAGLDPSHRSARRCTRGHGVRQAPRPAGTNRRRDTCRTGPYHYRGPRRLSADTSRPRHDGRRGRDRL